MNPSLFWSQAGYFCSPARHVCSPARHGVISLALVFCGALLGCGAEHGSCEVLSQADRHAEAAGVCSAAFTADGDVDAGLAAARSQLALDQDDAVLAWPERLTGTRQQAEALRLAARVWRRRNDVAAERSALEQALEIERSKAEPAVGAAVDASKEAWTLYLLAYLEWGQTRYRPSLAYALESAAAARREGNSSIESLAVEIQQGVLSAVGDLDGARAVQQLRQALVVEPSPQEAAFMLAHEGHLWLDSGRLSMARDATLRALEIAADHPDLGSTFFRSTHLNLVEIALQRGALERARHHLDAAWVHAVEPSTYSDSDPDSGSDGAGDNSPTSLLFYRAWLAQQEERWDDAAGDLTTALAASPVADWVWTLQQQLGQVEQARGNPVAAEAAFRAAIVEIEAMRQALALDTLQPWLLEKKRQTFEALFLLLLHQGRSDEALAIVERARARTFLDAFIRGLETARVDVERIGNGSPSGPPEDAPPGRSVQATQDPSAAGANALERLRALEALLPAVATAPSRTPRPVRNLRDELEGRSVLSYFEADGELWLLSGVAGGWRPIGNAAEIAARVDTFLARLDDRDLAAQLGAQLLPTDVLPVSGETVAMVTDGALGRLPFAALRIEGQYLVERNPITYVPSLEALAAFLERPRGAVGPPLVLGDPLGDLPGARTEAIAVAELVGSTPWLGAAARRGLLGAPAQPAVLHLATHTGLGPGGPWIALADGPLAADALITAGLAPRLAVLATCASAARPGREMWGSLGAVFLAAGSEAVVASLVSVPDTVAAAFALAFYRHGGLEAPVVAVANVQRRLLTLDRPVAEWAPFVVMGLSYSAQSNQPKENSHETVAERVFYPMRGSDSFRSRLDPRSTRLVASDRRGAPLAAGPSRRW